MPNKRNPLQDGIDYKAAVISEICSSPDVLRLLSDNPSLEIDSDQAFQLCDENIFDFNYIDRTVERKDAFIMVDVEMVSAPTGTMYGWHVFVQVVSYKGYARLNPKKFKGVKGNRVDNLVTQIDSLLNGSRLFGIGELNLQECSIAVVPDNFTSKMLTYRVEDFRKGQR